MRKNFLRLRACVLAIWFVLCLTAYASADYTTYVYTPKLSKVTVRASTWELTAAQIANWRTYVQNTYPKATRLRDASRKYNCHSYAWYSQSIINTYWMNHPGDDTYWLDGSYYEVFYCQSGLRDSYTYGDHSAIEGGTKGEISKWGEGPLMDHSYNYCPYNSSKIRSFKRR